MRTKVCHRKIDALHTSDPGEIDRLMTEAEAVILPESLYRTAADLAASVKLNIPSTESYQETAIIASYVLRFAFLLSQSGQLVEKPKGGQV